MSRFACFDAEKVLDNKEKKELIPPQKSPILIPIINEGSISTKVRSPRGENILDGAPRSPLIASSTTTTTTTTTFQKKNEMDHYRFVFRSTPLESSRYEAIKVVYFLASAEGYHQDENARENPDSRLSDKGIQQCKAMSKLLRKAQQTAPDLLLCSSLYRALHTMKLVCADWYGMVECKALEALRPQYNNSAWNRRSKISDLTAAFPHKVVFSDAQSAEDNHFGNACESNTEFETRLHTFLVNYMLPTDSSLYDIKTILKRFRKRDPEKLQEQVYEQLKTMHLCKNCTPMNTKNDLQNNLSSNESSATSTPKHTRVPSSSMSLQGVTSDNLSQIPNLVSAESNSEAKISNDITSRRASTTDLDRLKRKANNNSSLFPDDSSITLRNLDAYALHNSLLTHHTYQGPKRLVIITHRSVLDTIFTKIVESSTELKQPWRNCQLRKVFVYLKEQVIEAESRRQSFTEKEEKNSSELIGDSSNDDDESDTSLCPVDVEAVRASSDFDKQPNLIGASKILSQHHKQARLCVQCNCAIHRQQRVNAKLYALNYSQYSKPMPGILGQNERAASHGENKSHLYSHSADLYSPWTSKLSDVVESHNTSKRDSIIEDKAPQSSRTAEETTRRESNRGNLNVAFRFDMESTLASAAVLLQKERKLQRLKGDLLHRLDSKNETHTTESDDDGNETTHRKSSRRYAHKIAGETVDSGNEKSYKRARSHDTEERNLFLSTQKNSTKENITEDEEAPQITRASTPLVLANVEKGNEDENELKIMGSQGWIDTETESDSGSESGQEMLDSTDAEPEKKREVRHRKAASEIKELKRASTGEEPKDSTKNITIAANGSTIPGNMNFEDDNGTKIKNNVTRKRQNTYESTLTVPKNEPFKRMRSR